ncbi:MAG: hypothetical protein KDA37_09420 [Planctomycetales bacterium]|nr:hypothetical protein [Planctomycetales bacterium]MCB0900838.1 hypothetical protein [Actinomycetota bacterium]
MNRPLFSDVTHIEGMDLAGKSTATAHLVVSTRHGLQRNSLVPNNPIYAEADRLRRNGAAPDVLGPMYVRALDWDLNHMTSGRPRVQDSTILLRSLAFYEVLGHDQIVDQLHAMIPRHPRFGCTIVLTASIEARLVRLAERQRLAPDEVAPDDLMVITQPELFLDMERALVASSLQHFQAIELDTSRMTKAETKNAVNKLLAANRSGRNA